MKMKKLNLFEEQRKWMEQHRHADRLVFTTTKAPIQAIYLSPLERWKDLMAPDGIVDVPDMDYYNSLRNTAEIQDAINELFPETQEEQP
jgi:hypothetical protein